MFISLVLALIYGCKHSEMEDMCISPDCLKQVNYIVERMNSSMDPCEDFYQFACGHYDKIHVINDVERIHGVANDVEDEVYRLLRHHLESDEYIKSRAFRKARYFYSQCEEKFEEFKDIKQFMDSLLSYVDDYELQKYFAKITSYGSNPFFDIFIEEEGNSYRLVLSKPKPETKLTQLREDIYCEKELSQHYRSNTLYKELIQATFTLNGVQKTSSGKDLWDLIIDYESRLATSLSEISCDETPKYSCNMYKNKQPLAHEILRNLKISGDYSINSAALVNDSCPPYTAEVFCKLLNDSIARDYLKWRHFIRYLPLISTPFRRTYMALIKDMNKGNNVFDYPRYFPEKWKECVHITNHIYGMALAYLFKKKEYDEDGEEEIKSLAEAALEIYQNMINNQDWLDSNIAEKISQKLQELKIAIGGPEFISDRQKIKDFYASVRVEKDFILAILNNEEMATRFEFLNKPRMDEKWFMKTPPISSEIKYDVENNVLVLPMGALRFPYFISNYFKFSKYSSIGTLINQALYSAFRIEDILDNEGSENFADFLYEYQEKKNCFRYQYLNDTKLDEENIKQEDLRKSLEVIIRDNVALNVAFGLYQRDMDEEFKLPNLDYNALQLFFIQYAQTYCEVSSHSDWELGKHVTAKDRVNNVVSNSEAFSEVFSCSEKSAMNRENKCQMWN